VMLGVVVAHVFEAGVPVDTELIAGNLVRNPEVTHLHGMGALAFYSVVGNPSSGGVVTVYGGGWLGVAEFMEDEAKDAAFLGVDKEGAKFGFCGRGGNKR
jgi:hypothetical protein